MPRKQSGPALYEMMRDRRSSPRPAAPPPAQEEPSGSGWLSPGRTVRMPIGYLLLGAAIAVVALVGSFTIGYGRGEADARAEADRTWLAANQQNLAVPPPEIPAQRARQTAPPSARPAQEPTAAPSSSSRAPAGWGPIESDPREAGKNYFILVHTQREPALRFARFCRDNGVEAYVVRPNNSSLYKVLALPGYAPGGRSAPFVTELERRIEAVARKWKAQVNARDDIVHYLEKFEG
jgi:hypothetical protein